MDVLTFEIFSGGFDKDAVWVEAVQSFGNAYARMTEIAAEKPGTYFIFYRDTRQICGSIDTSVRELEEQDATVPR
jgi:hypothetical protein